MNTVVAKSFRSVGADYGGVTRRAVSYTPIANLTLNQFSIVGRRESNPATVGVPVEINSLIWEIRSEVAGPRPSPDTTTPLATGTYNFAYSSAWALFKVLKYTITLPTPLTLLAGVRYWFVIKVPGDIDNMVYPFYWADTYNTGAVGEVSAAVFNADYGAGGWPVWSAGDATFNLQLFVPINQAGSAYHVVIDDIGYMQPDEMKGFTCQQVAAGLAATKGGQAEYSQLRYPYSNFSQDDWTSGIGQLNMSDPNSYLYGLALDTTVPNQAIIGPKSFIRGLHTTNDSYTAAITAKRYLPDMEHTTSAAPVQYYAQKFTPAANYNMTLLGAVVKRNVNPIRHVLSICVCADLAGSPTGVAAGGLTGWQVLTPTLFWRWAEAVTGATALVIATPYWVVIKTNQGWGSSPDFEIMFDTTGLAVGGPAKYASAGLAWAALTQSMNFRINGGHEGDLDGNVTKFAYGPITVPGTPPVTTKYFCVVAGKKVYQWDAGTDHFIDISTGITSHDGHTHDSLDADGTDLIFFNDGLFVSQGYSYPMRRWDGTTWGPGDMTKVILGGEFETPADLACWTVSANVTLASDPDGVPPPAVSNCGLLTSTAGAGRFISQNFIVVPGDSYELTFYHKNGAGGGATYTGDWWAGEHIGDTDIHGVVVMSDVAWTKKHYIFTIPAGMTTMFVHFATTGVLAGDKTKFDRIELHRDLKTKSLQVSRGFLWADDAINTIRHTNTGSSWSAKITVGDITHGITDMTDYAGRFLVGKENGIWDIDTVSGLAQEYTMFSGQAWANNCRGWEVWSGMLFIPVQSSIWRWTTSSYKEVGASNTKSGPTASWPNVINSLASSASLLFGAASPQTATGWGGLMAYNGLGWHNIGMHLKPLQANNTIYMTTDFTNDYRIWFGEGKKVDFVIMSSYTNNRYDDPLCKFMIMGGYLVTSWWDGGVKDALKTWSRVTILADIPAECSITCYYAKDGEDWQTVADMVLLGEVTAEDLDSNDEYVFLFPDGLVAREVQLIICLNTISDSKTPRLRAFNLECVVRQIPVDAYSFRILLADNILKLDGSSDTRLADAIWDDLRAARKQNAPITVSFPSHSIRGMISQMTVRTRQYKPDGAERETWERFADVSVIELT